jgi:hypothetical protein
VAQRRRNLGQHAVAMARIERTSSERVEVPCTVEEGIADASGQLDVGLPSRQRPAAAPRHVHFPPSVRLDAPPHRNRTFSDLLDQRDEILKRDGGCATQDVTPAQSQHKLRTETKGAWRWRVGHDARLYASGLLTQRCRAEGASLSSAARPARAEEILRE